MGVINQSKSGGPVLTKQAQSSRMVTNTGSGSRPNGGKFVIADSAPKDGYKIRGAVPGALK